jgi:hypothetical protein
MILLGGIGRVLSMLTFGIPSPAFISFAALELAFPLSLVWQGRLSPLEHHQPMRAGQASS